MKVVLWIANEPIQKALAHKIHSVFPVTAIVTETRKFHRKITLPLLATKAIEKLFLSSIDKSWWEMFNHYERKFPNYPDVELLDVENINNSEAFAFTTKFKPDLIIVSGTRLIREKMLSIRPSIGILNLHTGLSPYVKGGPNCTNWCIANNEFHLIGNTVMWIDAGIDSGNILVTEFTGFNGNETLGEVHVKVMEHAQQLYLNAITYVSNGGRQSIPQYRVATGKTYFIRQWTLRQKFRLLKNFRFFKDYFISGKMKNDREKIKTVSL